MIFNEFRVSSIRSRDLGFGVRVAPARCDPRKGGNFSQKGLSGLCGPLRLMYTAGMP